MYSALGFFVAHACTAVLLLIACVQVNTEIVAIQRVITPAGEAQLKGLIQQHADKTGSKKAAALLSNWASAKDKFWQIVPPGGLFG